MFFEFLYCTFNCLCKLRWIFAYKIWKESGSFLKWENEEYIIDLGKNGLYEWQFHFYSIFIYISGGYAIFLCIHFQCDQADDRL